MELVKVKDIINYEGKLYLIRPYIEEGKIKRKTIFTDIKKKGSNNFSFNKILTLGRFSKLNWYHTKFHIIKKDEIVTDDTIASETYASCPLRLFTDRESAKKALEEYEAQNAYRLNESIDKELKYQEEEKKKLNNKIKELKERKKECFKLLTTTFSSKS